MSITGDLAALLRQHRDAIIRDMDRGDERAKRVIETYGLCLSCPRDHAAPALCLAALHEWLGQRNKDAY